MNSLPNADLAFWAKDVSKAVLHMTTGDVLRNSAHLHPERLALVEVIPSDWASLSGAESICRKWTFRQLFNASEQCAGWLLTKFEPGERICVWAPNIPEWVILQYGAALAGLILVTANPALKANELAFILEQSKATGLFHTSKFRGTDMQAVVDEIGGGVRQVLCFDHWQKEVAAFSGDIKLPNVDPMDAAQIQYTSGTTGQPKGALLHHMGLVTNARFVSDRAGIQESVVISPMPLFHTAGSVLSSLGCVVSASTYVLPIMFEPELVMSAIQREKCTAIFGVPTMQLTMLEHPKRSAFDLSSLRVAISGGAPVPPELLSRIEDGFHCDLLNVFGQTECSPIICQTAPSDSRESKHEGSGVGGRQELL